MNGSLALVALACAQTFAADSSTASFAARFEPNGLYFQPANGATLRLGAVELRRGEERVALDAAPPRNDGAFTLFDRAPGVLERFERTAAGIEHSLVIDGPLGGDGDLVVRVALGGANAELGERRANGTHRFGSITYGRLFGIDADGDRTDGDVRLVDGGLELVIDDAWLDAAAWPITLDPIVGADFDITTPTSPDLDSNSDAAYDATTNTYLVVFQRKNALGFDAAFAQRLDANGGLLGSPINLAASGRHVRIARVARAGRFAVAWVSPGATTDRIQMRLVNPANGALSSTLTLTEEPIGDLDQVDIAGETSLSVAVPERAFVVWGDKNGGVRFARVNTPAVGDPTLVGTSTVQLDPSIFDRLTTVRISHGPNVDGHMGVAWVHDNAPGSTRKSYATIVDRSGSKLLAPVLECGTEDSVLDLSIDGGGTNPAQYIVANGTNDWVPSAIVAPLTWNGSSLTVGATVDHATSLYQSQVNVAWRPGAAFLTYIWEGSSYVKGLDPLTAATFQSKLEFAQRTSGSIFGVQFDEYPLEPLLCLQSTGNDAHLSGGLIAYTLHTDYGTSNFEELHGRRFDAFSPLATSVDQGGGCGGVGTIVAPQPPALGNGTFRLELAGAPPSAVLAILNIAAPQATLDCGACRWLPFGTTYTLNVVGGSASKALAVPAQASLAGAVADVQWTVVAPGVAPCAAAPDIGVSNILRLTLN
jgi:hypothetical protein